MYAIRSYYGSKDQQEVWKVVQDTWKAWKSGDVKATFQTFHEKYQGWSDDSPIPIGKASLQEWFSSMKDMMTLNFYNIEPARITVLKDAAVVDYFYYLNMSYAMGDEKGSKETKGKVRITSYNVCYTKLLRDCKSDRLWRLS